MIKIAKLPAVDWTDWMKAMAPAGLGYRMMIALGVALLLLALVLSFTLPLPERLRYAVTGLIGLAGWGVTRLARSFR